MDSFDDIDALTSIISALKKLSRDEQQRTLQAVATFLNIDLWRSGFSETNGASEERPPHQPAYQKVYSEDRAMSAKDFLRDKSPQTDIERVACLAYYLTHFRDVPHFKTLDISTLNTEAAQPKFSSASVAVDNATKAGLLVQAVKGNKQMSAAGERYVQLLPDRDAARQSIQMVRSKRKGRKSAPGRANNKRQVK